MKHTSDVIFGFHKTITMRKLLFLFILLAGCARPDTSTPAFDIPQNHGIWEVQVYFRGNKNPWSLAPRYTLSLPIQIRAMKTPTIAEIGKVKVPFDGFSVCTECPYTIKQIKAPIEQPIAPIDTLKFKAPVDKM